MNNTWIVVPVISNDVDLSALVNKLSGGYVAPETYEKKAFSQETKTVEILNEPHPYAGQNGPDFSNRIIFVNNIEGYIEHENVIHLEDFNDISIYRYWNTGFEHAVANGADSVILTNGLIDFDTFIIKDAYDELLSSGKEIINIMDGAMLLISATSSIRADEQFQIWFGDNDLYRRSVAVSKTIRKEYSKSTNLIDINSIESFSNIVASDEAKYNAKWS